MDEQDTENVIREEGSLGSRASCSRVWRIVSSRSFHTFLGILVSVVLLAWVVSGIDIQAVREPLWNAHYWMLIPSFGVLLIHFYLRAWRWYYLLPNGGRTGLGARLDSIMIGNFANFVLPLRAGEFVRPLLLSRLTQTSFAEGFASIVTERFFDLAAAIITFALLLPYFPAMPEWISTSAWILGGIAVCILLFVIYVIFAPHQTLRIFDYLFSERVFAKKDAVLVKKARHFLVDFIASAHVLASPSRLLVVLLLTGLVWLSNYALHTVFLYLIDVPHTALLGTTVGVVIALAVAAPSAPGFLGVYQTACLASFALFGLAEEPAFVYSVITHLFQYVVFIGYGVFILMKTGLRLKELREGSQSSLEQLS